MKAKIHIVLLLLTSKEKTPGTAPSRTEAEAVRMNSFMFGVWLLRSVGSQEICFMVNWCIYGFDRNDAVEVVSTVCALG
jgi:hypothetical protein